MTPLDSAKILKLYFERKRAARPGFSMRSFAKELNVAPSFVSSCISGKKAIPLARLPELIKILELDHAASDQLKRALVLENLREHGLDIEDFAKQKTIAKYKPAPKSQFSLLNPWYNVAIMDLTTCKGFKKDFAWIAKRLNISAYQAEQSVKQLILRGFLKEHDSGYEKVTENIRLSGHESHAEIRKYHSQMMDLAKHELLTKTSKESFALREISGITIAANPTNVAKARKHLVDAIHTAAEMLSKGPCTDLFQINVQLFSLLTTDEK